MVVVAFIHVLHKSERDTQSLENLMIDWTYRKAKERLVRGWKGDSETDYYQVNVRVKEIVIVVDNFNNHHQKINENRLPLLQFSQMPVFIEFNEILLVFFL